MVPLALHYDASFFLQETETWRMVIFWRSPAELVSEPSYQLKVQSRILSLSEISYSTWGLKSWHCTCSNFYLKSKSIGAKLLIPVWSQAKSQLSTIYEIVTGARETELLYLFSLRWSLSPDNCKREWTYSSKVSFTISSLASSVHSSCLLTATELCRGFVLEDFSER